MPTLKDVAKLSGVTVTTISRMLNNRGNVSPKTRAKIQAAMKELDYTPNELAQSLTKKKSNFIGLIVPSAKNVFFSSLIDSIEHFVSQKGYKLLLCISDMDTQKELEYFSMLKGNKVTGVIVTSLTQGLSEHIPFDSPIIFLGRLFASEIHTACTDDYSGGKLAASHLILKGCKYPAYLCDGPSIGMYADKRLQGFYDACLNALNKEPFILHTQTPEFINLNYKPLISKLFNEHGNVDGITTSNDIIAAQTIQYCNLHNIKIPDQVKLVSYDDTDLASLCYPKLTSIHQPLEALCEYAVNSIIHMSENKPIPMHQLFPVELIEREST